MSLNFCWILLTPFQTEEVLRTYSHSDLHDALRGPRLRRNSFELPGPGAMGPCRHSHEDILNMLSFTCNSHLHIVAGETLLVIVFYSFSSFSWFSPSSSSLSSSQSDLFQRHCHFIYHSYILITFSPPMRSLTHSVLD